MKMTSSVGVQDSGQSETSDSRLAATIVIVLICLAWMNGQALIRDDRTSDSSQTGNVKKMRVV
jgi:hypothetical protein